MKPCESYFRINPDEEEEVMIAGWIFFVSLVANGFLRKNFSIFDLSWVAMFFIFGNFKFFL